MAQLYIPAATNGRLLRYAPSHIEADAYGSPTAINGASPGRVRVLNPVTYVSPGPVLPSSPSSLTNAPRLVAPTQAGASAANPSTRLSLSNQEEPLPKRPETETLLKDPELGAMMEGPEELEEYVQPWGRFIALWLCCTLAGGILPGQALFASQFAEAGIFGSMCGGKEGTCKDQYLALTGIFGVGQYLAYGFLAAPIGLLYDRYGAMAIGTSGAVICATGLGLVTASCFGAAAGMDATTSWLFVAGAFTCDFGSMLNSFSFMGVVWHFPRNQTLVIALINATYQASAFIPLVLQAGMDATGSPLSTFMCLWSLVVACTALGCYKLIPTQREFYDQAKRVLGIPLPKPPADMRVCEMLKRGGRVLALCKQEHIFSAIALSLGFGLPSYYASMTAPYGAALFGHKADGERLAELNVLCTSIVGLALGPFTGVIGDKFGLMVIVYLFVAIMGLSTLTMGLASWPAQAFTAGCLSLFLSLFSIFISRYLLKYSPPNRYGAVQGVYTLGVMMLTMAWSIGGLSAAAALPPGIDAYRIPMMVFGACGFFGLALYAAYFRSYPPPEVPPMLPEDEAELAQGFGCSTLEEVAEVTNTSREELMKTLSSNKPEDIRSLMSRMDKDKMMEIMSKHSVNDSAESEYSSSSEEEEEVEKQQKMVDADLPETAHGG